MYGTNWKLDIAFMQSFFSTLKLQNALNGPNGKMHLIFCSCGFSLDFSLSMCVAVSYKLNQFLRDCAMLQTRAPCRQP
jgi:hypothetical protein